MELIDTHCHLTVLRPEELSDIFERAFAKNVTKCICIGAIEGDKGAAQAIAISKQYHHVWASIGIHPHDAKDFPEIPDFGQYLKDSKVVAIGETGLDYFRDWSPKEKQMSLFKSSIELAKQCRKPLIIHCRDAEEDVFKTLKQSGADEVGGVFHCYAGDAEFAKKLRSINFLVSFTGNITFKKASALRETVKGIPIEQIMVETDMPYMAPEPDRGKPSEPMHVYYVAKAIADIKELALEDVARTTTENAKRLFSI